MFTLKLYRRMPVIEGAPNHKQAKIIEVARIVSNEIGQKGQALELWAMPSNDYSNYETYYVGEPEEGMDAFGKRDLHLNSPEPGSWWGWAFLENSEGQTTERYTPASYG